VNATTLAVLAGFVLLAAYVILRGRLQRLRQPGGGPIHVSARFMLEPRKNLYVVKAGTEYMLLGTSERGIHFLTELDGDGVEGILREAALARPETGFGDLFRTLRRQNGEEKH
jgi:flagellar biogenesis protein FliO